MVSARRAATQLDSTSELTNKLIRKETLKTRFVLISILSLGVLAISCQKNVEVKPGETSTTAQVAQTQPEVAPAGAAAQQQLPPGHPPIEANKAGAAAAAPVTVSAGEIKKVDGGFTIQECFNQKASLKGKTVKVRGKVVKYNSGIMGKNWIHIQDGTGAAGENDLTVTTKQDAALNDVIVVSGNIQYDKNIGSGYSFAALIEDGSIVK